MSPASQHQWKVRLQRDFKEEFDELTAAEQDDLLTAAKALKLAGPAAGRPYVDTLKGSKHDNMKELRYKSEDGSQVWRAAFAFDPNKQAVILCAADKQGVPSGRFYKTLISKADVRFDSELKRIEEGQARSETRRREAATAGARTPAGPRSKARKSR